MEKAIVTLAKNNTCTAWNYNGQRLAAGSVDGTLAIYDSADPASSNFSFTSKFKVHCNITKPPFVLFCDIFVQGNYAVPSFLCAILEMGSSQGLQFTGSSVNNDVSGRNFVGFCLLSHQDVDFSEENDNSGDQQLVIF